MSLKAIYIPNGLAKIHPGLEPALKSIQAALEELKPQAVNLAPANSSASSSGGGTTPTTSTTPARTFAYWAS